MVDVGSRAPMCKELLLKDWIVHRDRPRPIEMDQMLDTLHHDLGINTEVVPGDAPWKLSITGVIMRLVKRTAHMRRIKDEMLPVKRVFCKL